jgi:hypothetical protein
MVLFVFGVDDEPDPHDAFEPQGNYRADFAGDAWLLVRVQWRVENFRDRLGSIFG